MHRLFFVLILLVATNGFAAEVANLYQSQAAVLSQDEAERQQVSANILNQVLLKVVGDSMLLESADIAPILAQSNQMVQQYQYQRTNVIADDLTQPDRLELVMSFKKSAVNQALIDVGLPIWSESRPETLVWLAVEKGSKRWIVSADEQSDFVTALKQSADNRGLPILLAVMDLQDQSQVTFTDLSAGFSQSIEDASLRYRAPVTLMVYAKINNNGLAQVRWHARVNGQSEQWQSRGDVASSMKAGIDELTDRLARRFSQRIDTAEQRSLALHISGVKDYQDYVRIVNYLKTLQYVTEVQVASLEADTLDLKLTFNGDITVLNRTVAIDRVLQQEPYSPTDTINYRLLP